jgi:hypothetical protein
MTLPDLPAGRKPPRRLWLFGPYVVLVVAAILWSGAWLWIRGQVAARLDAAAAHSALNGPSLAWDHRRIGGYPFRIEVVLDNARASEASGWGLQAPQVRAETYAYDLKHWIAYAPRGVVLSRPGAGAVAIAGQALRASVAAEAPGQTRISLEGLKLVFTPAPGARGFPLAAADHIDAHVRPAGPDQVEFLLQLQGAAFSPTSLIGRLAAGQPVASAWHGTLSKASALAGGDWPQAARAWAAAGGGVELIGGGINAGPVALDVSGGHLGVGPDGRLQGTVSLGLAHAPASLAAFGRAGALDPALASAAGEIAAARAALSPTAKADLTFQAGVATFGPIAIGPAPRVY